MTTGKTIPLTRWTFVGKVVSLFFNSFSSKEQASFNFISAVSICSDFGSQENKVCHCFHCFPIYLPWSDGTGCHDLSFWMLSFKPTFSFSAFTSIEWLFSSSALSAIRVVSSLYLRLLIFFSAILISAWGLSSPSFRMIYSACKLNKQGDNMQPCHTPFPVWNQSIAPCLVLTVASWPAYRFPRRQVRWSGIPNSLRIFHKRLSQTCLWVSERLLWRHGSAVACHRERDSGYSRPGRCSMWHKSSWRRSPLAPP